jgi:predicted HicB family RNase H-like nuclease
MNLRIRPEEKQRIGLLALRENVCINEVFSRMLELYEREHGRDELAPVKSKAEKK